METFLLLVGLALGLTLALRAVEDLMPFHAPAALGRLIAVAVAIVAVWAIDYSVLASLGQEARAAWIDPVVTGVVLVAIGEVVRQLVDGVSARTATHSPKAKAA